MTTVKTTGKILLPLNRQNHSVKRIREIIELEKDKTFDLLHIIGVDPQGTDYCPWEELKDLPEIGKCYRCDARELMANLRENYKPDVLLADFQLRQIVLTAVLAKAISLGRYEKKLYYGPGCDYRLTQITASMIMRKPQCLGLMQANEEASKIERRMMFGYTMKEKEIRKLVRVIRPFLKTIKIEKVECF